jgi:hypothetical protein
MRREKIIMNDETRAALRTAMIDTACVAFARENLTRISRDESIQMLVWLNQWRGFALDADGATHHEVQFSPEEFGEILHEAAAREARRQPG